MKKIVGICVLVILAQGFFSCTKVVNYDLAGMEPRVVIEASILQDSVALVRVSKTAEYLKNQPTPVITNAFIVISDNMGNRDTLDHEGNGYYRGDIIIGSTAAVYTLLVVAEGKEYTASTSVPDRISFNITGYNYKGPNDVFNPDRVGYYPTIQATLPSGVDSYYLFKYYLNGALHKPEGSESDIFISDSKYVGTNIEGYETPYPYNLGDECRIDIYRITKEAYDFYFDLASQLQNDGGFFSTPPANTRSNFNNGAIGVFMGGSVSAESVQIQ